MRLNGDGRQAITRVVLGPRVTYAGGEVDEATDAALHHEAHELCYIANSVRTEVLAASRRATGGGDAGA